MRATQLVEALGDLLGADLDLGARGLEAVVLDALDQRQHFDASLVAEGFVLFEPTRLDRRIGHGLQLLLADRLRIRLVDQALRDVSGDARPVQVREHLARRAPGAKPADAGSFCDRCVGFLDLAFDAIDSDLHIELDQYGTEPLNVDLHRKRA